MDVREDSGVQITGGGQEHELSLSTISSQTESGSAITLQLLEFKTLLHEVVEELQIQRDSKMLFEDQISKLVLEKQELEWEKESLQRQTETATNQHSDALMNMQIQFQDKIRNIEEVKGKYQIAAELKDKEMNNLKEELKSLQLLKYRLEKKVTELEQKLALQCRSKDSHLNQLGEVEKRFRALLRQCNTVKQAHEKLEQNVDEVLQMNTKLTSANGRHVSTTESLQKELEEVSEKLIKANMSTFRQDRAENLTTTKQRIQQLHLKLNKETEMNKKLQEENLTVRAEKQEVMRALHHTQQQLLNQTQAVKKVEMELQTQKEQNQALKQEHDIMQEKNKAMENNAVQLMQRSVVSKTSWDKKEITGEETHKEAVSSAELPALQDSVADVIETKTCPEDPQANQGANEATEGQNPNHQQQLIPSNSSTFHPAICNLNGLHGAAGSLLNRDVDKSHTSQSVCDGVSDSLHNNVSFPGNSLQISNTVPVSCSDQKSIDKLLDRDKSYEMNGRRTGLNERFDIDVEEGETNREQQCEESNVKEKGQVIKQTADKAARQEGNQPSAEDARGSKQSKTIKENTGEGGDVTIKGEENENASEKQTGAWISSYPTTGEKQKTDFIHAETPRDASMPPECSVSLPQKEDRKDMDIHQPFIHTPTSVDAQLSSHDEVQSFAEDASLSTNKENRASLSMGLFTVSTSPATSSRPSCQTTQPRDGAPASTAGLSSENHQKTSCSSISTEQPSFRAQLSKIEQFLNADRLHLHKRQRTDQ